MMDADIPELCRGSQQFVAFKLVHPTLGTFVAGADGKIGECGISEKQIQEMAKEIGATEGKILVVLNGVSSDVAIRLEHLLPDILLKKGDVQREDLIRALVAGLN